MSAAKHAHEEAQELLPWVANGSLTGTELDRVQTHLHTCADCRTELALLHTLRAAGSAQGAPHIADPEAALARLLPQLDAPAPPPAQAGAAPVPPGWRTRLAANDRSWLRAAVSLQCCVIGVLCVMLARPSASPEAQAGAYRLLGAGAGAGAGSGLVVAFRPDTPERELRRIVLASGARVVGGPTVTGAWLLDTGEAPDVVLARLRAEQAVMLAETLGAQGRP